MTQDAMAWKHAAMRPGAHRTLGTRLLISALLQVGNESRLPDYWPEALDEDNVIVSRGKVVRIGA
jgi:hypothetical protein